MSSAGDFAQVAHVLLVGHAQHERIAAALDRLAGVVEGIPHLLHPVARHCGVDLAGQFDEAGVVLHRAQLPRG